MPYASPHVCPAPGCRRLAPRGQRCEQHQAAMDQAREVAQGFYHTPAWRRLRAAHLRAFPTCVACGGPARVVDHVVSRSQAPDRALDPSNLRSMCNPCHSSRTASTDGRWGDR